MELYTAGQLAKLCGVSARTIRYYDQRDILPPAGYSEGGYRLYDENAVKRMQRILMLKFAGLSLEDIQSTLLLEEGQPFLDVLEDQRELLIQRKEQMEQVIRFLEDVQSQKGENIDKLVEMMQIIKSVNHSGSIYRFYEANGQRNLYPFEFNQLQLEEGMQILDAGCGYGLLWRFGWHRIPRNLHVTMVDVYRGVLDRFNEFYDENVSKLEPGAGFLCLNQDFEHMEFRNQYDRIILAYAYKYMKSPEETMKKFYNELKQGGFLMLVDGGGDIMEEYDDLYYQYSGEYCLKSRWERQQKKREEMKQLLERQFDRVEQVVFENPIQFDRPLELYRFLMDSYEELVEELKKQGIGFVNFLRKYMAEQGTVTFNARVYIYRCYKEEDNIGKTVL